MTLHRIAAIEVVRHPVLRLTYDDGLSGEYDLAPFIAMGPLFGRLTDPAYFQGVAIGERGRTFGWNLDEIGHEIDFCPDAARMQIETDLVDARASQFEARFPSAAA